MKLASIAEVPPVLCSNKTNSKNKRMMSSSNFGYYIFCLLAFVVGFLFVKKLAGCLIKTVIMAVLLAVLAAFYFLYIKA